MKKKGIVLLGVFAVLCAIIFTCRLWPVFDMRDSEGNIDKRGAFHFLDPILDPNYNVGTHVVLEVDKEKIPEGMTQSEALTSAYEHLNDRIVGEDQCLAQILIKKNDKQIFLHFRNFRDPGRLTEKSLNGIRPSVGFKLINEKIKTDGLADNKGNIFYSKVPKNISIKKDREGRLAALENEPVISGDDIINAWSGGLFGKYKVWVKFTRTGGRRFEDFTAKNLGRKYAIMFDEYMFMAPVIKSKFTGQEGIIADSLTKEDAKDLVLVLRAGINVPVKIISKEFVDFNFNKNKK
jgi:preprotein translocase subunit SecD